MTIRTAATLRMAAAVSAEEDTVHATERAAAQLNDKLAPGLVDLAIAFVNPPHARRLATVGDVLKRELEATHILAVTAGGVVAGAREIEEGPAISVLAARMPGVTIHPFTHEDLPHDPHDPSRADELARAVGVADDLRCTFLFADPFSVPLLRFLPALSAVVNRGQTDTYGGETRRPALLGGMLSAAPRPGSNALVVSGREVETAVRNEGLVGVSLRGELLVDTIVSQGCRPFGEPMVVTAAKQNVILKIAGKPAAQAIREACLTLSEEDRRLLVQGQNLFIGKVVNEYKHRFGRGDFLIRNIVGADENSGAVAVGDLIRPGQTIQMHLRDARTAAEDMALLMDGQAVHETPAGALLITCNGRGQRFFGRPDHDARALQRPFLPTPGGETAAKAGWELSAAEAPVPTAGFFAAGEIGPVGDQSYLHGFTACAALFRPRA